jgi:hypothetical protein
MESWLYITLMLAPLFAGQAQATTVDQKDQNGGLEHARGHAGVHVVHAKHSVNR